MLRLSTLLLVLAALLPALLPALLASQVSYEGHKYVRVNTDSEKIHQWFFDDFDVLRARRSAFDLHVSPAQLELLSALDLDVQILHDNVQRLIELDMPRASAERAEVSLNSTWFSDYHRYDEVKAWYQELARANSGATFISSIGKSHQNRDLFAFTFGTAGKPGIFIQGRQHAREWIGGAALDYLVWHFLTQDKSLLNDFQFIIVPIVNPDGYEYSWTNDRLWRKNRRNNGSTYGVDLNRNWNSHWGQGGSSSNPASDTYMGPSVASEPEVQAVSKFFLTYTNIIAGFDFHAYSQLILRPYGWKNGNAEHETVLFAAAEIIQEEIKAVHGKDFENIHSIELYVTTGTTSDWFYDDEVKAKLGHRIYAYTLELRPSTAIPGFNLPPDQIIPSGEELVPALKAFVTYANSNQIRT